MRRCALLCGCIAALAQACASAASVHARSSRCDPAQAQLDLLLSLEAEGYLSPAQAARARSHLVRATSSGTTDPDASQSGQLPSRRHASRLLSLANFVKLVALICLLVALRDLLSTTIWALVVLITRVPVQVYQAAFAAAASLGTLRPGTIWASQAVYVALLSAFANLLLAGWIVHSHERLSKATEHFFATRKLAPSLLSLLLAAYFGALALASRSSVFGFFAVVCLSGVTSFGMYYYPGTLYLHFDRDATSAVVFGHLAVLCAHAALKATGGLPQVAPLFEAGIEYYCTIAMCVGLLCGASPFEPLRSSLPYTGVFVVTWAAAMAGYFFLDLQPVGAISCVFAVLLALEWIMVLSFRAGWALGMIAVGVALFGGSLVLERYGHHVGL